VTGVVRYAGRAAAPVSVLALLAGLGLPAVAAAAVLAVLVLAAVCWVLASGERSDRTARIILGLRGDARCLYPADGSDHGAPPALAPAPALSAAPRVRRPRNQQ
jgi:hypothetical protein